MISSMLAGFGLGFLVAAQVGPIWLLAARGVIRGGLRVGIAIGLGAATIDIAYGALGLLGASSLLRIPQLRLALGALGAGVLVVMGALAVRGAFRRPDTAGTVPEIAAPRRAYLIALGATAANPLTIVSWAAVFAAASTAHIAHTAPMAVLLLLGIGLGTSAWFALLSIGMSLLRRLAGRRVQQVIDLVSGIGLIGFAGALAYESLAHM